MTKILNIVVIVLCLMSQKFYGQENGPTFLNPKPLNNNAPKDFEKFTDRIYFGGNVGFWFGTTTYINVAPLVGFKVNRQLSIGGGFTYNYFSQTYGARKYEYSVYGPNVFARYAVLENLFLQVGFDRLSVPDYRTGLLNSRAWVDNVLVGGGYRQKFSDKASFIVLVFYNINETPLSPYQNPIVQMGFNVGF